MTLPGRTSRLRLPRLRSRRGSLLLLGFSAAHLLMLAVLLVIEHAVAERHWLATAITYTPQHPFALPGLALLGVSLVFRSRLCGVLNAAALLIFIFTLWGYNVPLGAFRPPPEAQTRRVRLLTYNVHHSVSGGITVADVALREKPDIVCLQEANSLLAWSDAANEALRVLEGWHMARIGELATLTRYPIRSQRIHQLDPTTGRLILETTLDLGDRTLTVFNIHLPTALAGKSLRKRNIPLSHYLRETGAVRAQNSRKILELAAEAAGPVVIAGDFNTPPRGRIYRRVCRDYSDAFRAAGWGTGFTYRSNLPVMRIDYVFAGKGIRTAKARVLREEASDHRPLSVELVVP